MASEPALVAESSMVSASAPVSTRIFSRIRSAVLSAIVFALHAYRLIVSPLLGPACRFEPSCSHFFEDAIRRHGLLRGAWLGLARLFRCHPLHPGGYDPVP